MAIALPVDLYGCRFRCGARGVAFEAMVQRREAPRPDKDLLTAWLLLLLDDGVAYGYSLRRELETHGLSIDAGAMYRILRRLESDGCVRSRWVTSHTGPQRRAYRVTAKGRRARADAARLVATVRDTHESFLQAYDGHGSATSVGSR
jgi:DNA-binding PadR family transcriptional regulator